MLYNYQLINSFLQYYEFMRKLRQRRAKRLAQQDPRANKWQNQDLKPGTPGPMLLRVFVNEKSN